MYSYGPLHMDEQKQDDQLEHTYSSNCMATYQPSRKLSKLDEPDMWDTAGEVRTNI